MPFIKLSLLALLATKEVDVGHPKVVFQWVQASQVSVAPKYHKAVSVDSIVIEQP